MNSLNNLIGLKTKRKELRNFLTPAEARLWNYLKNSQLGFKFRRQHSVEYYILDFYCPKKMLAIELDGSPHDTDQGYIQDRLRDKDLQIKVPRRKQRGIAARTPLQSRGKPRGIKPFLAPRLAK